MKFKMNESNEIKFEPNDIVQPKSEWLGKDEKQIPYIVLDSWFDTDLNREKISIVSKEEHDKIANGTLKGFPHSRMDTFADYFEFIE